MRVETFPQCCGAGVLVIDNLTGKGEKADLELIKSYMAFAKRNGYRMYDFPEEYNGVYGEPRSSKSLIGGTGDRKRWESGNSWGMLLAITCPNQREAGQRLQQLGFKELFQTINPFYHSRYHKIILWGIDLTTYTPTMLMPDIPEKPIDNPFKTMTGTLGCLASRKPRDAKGRFTTIQKAPV